jgi:hypothetical protein
MSQKEISKADRTQAAKALEHRVGRYAVFLADDAAILLKLGGSEPDEDWLHQDASTREACLDHIERIAERAQLMVDRLRDELPPLREDLAKIFGDGGSGGGGP